MKSSMRRTAGGYALRELIEIGDLDEPFKFISYSWSVIRLRL
jgi:hypothetical protein